MNSSCNSNAKINVMVVGAAGGIGKVLSAFLSQSNFVAKLILCDIAPTKGMAAELNHLDSGCKVYSQEVSSCDKDIDCVLMPCGKPQSSPDEKRDDLFKFNANIFKTLMETIAGRVEKMPTYVVIGNPVNSLTVVCAETLKRLGKYDPKRLIGLNELDAMRSQRFIADLKGLCPDDVNVPFLGGHSEKTITPILSKITDKRSGKAITLTEEERKKIFDDIRFAGDRILAAYDNRGTAVLSTAYSVFRLTQALYTDKYAADETFYAYTEHGQMTDAVPRFLTVPVQYNNGSVSRFMPIDDLVSSLSDDCRKTLFEEVQRNIKIALDTLETLNKK